MSRAARHHLAATCPFMAGLVSRVGPARMAIQRQIEPFESLVRAISHQQLHGNAARAIMGRFTALFPDGFPTPDQVLATEVETLRACGLSAGKIASIRDIALHAREGVVPTRRAAARMSDEAIVERLIVIRGVGRWTVEMMLMFCLGRPDILPVDDFGVREGYRRLYGLEAQPKPRALAEAGAMWSPWRSVAAWYLWRAAEEGKSIAQPR